MTKRKRLERATRWRRLPNRKDTTVTSMVLPTALHERISIAAVKLNWSLAEVVRVAVADWLDRHEPRGTHS